LLAGLGNPSTPDDDNVRCRRVGSGACRILVFQCSRDQPDERRHRRNPPAGHDDRQDDTRGEVAARDRQRQRDQAKGERQPRKNTKTGRSFST
jgi:hypothetical protein